MNDGLNKKPFNLKFFNRIISFNPLNPKKILLIP